MKSTPVFLGAAIAVGVWSLLNPTTLATQKLLPFQGRLTDATGTPVTDGAKVVQFKIYDAPTGGTAVWNGEVQKLTVNGGLVSTLLGSKAEFTSAVDFNQPLYLEITVDANADSQITAADPPLLPRQSVLPAVFAVEAQSARDSQKLGGFDWTALFDNGNPITGRINASRLADGSITTIQLAPNSVDASRVLDGQIENAKLAANAVTTEKIVDGSILAQDLSPSLQTSLVLPGTVVAYAGATAPANSGWLVCDGSAVSRVAYPALFATIGTTHGVGDAATTFNLPDYRGLFLRGVNAGAARDPDAATRTAMATGGNAGNTVGSIQADELKSHAHDLSATITRPQGGVIGGFGPTPSRAPDDANFIFAKPTGGNETRPKNAYVNYIIKY